LPEDSGVSGSSIDAVAAATGLALFVVCLHATWAYRSAAAARRRMTAETAAAVSARRRGA
jgi:hypothetical protein